MGKLDNSMKLSDIKVDDYLAMYIPGGHGKAALYPSHCVHYAETLPAAPLMLASDCSASLLNSSSDTF